MSITVKTKGSFSVITKRLKEIDKDFTTGAFLEKTAQKLNSSIQTRVQKEGKGSNGLTMKPYSASYALFKERSGRKSNFRDLTFSGKMWNSLTTSKGRNRAKMFFGNAESVNKASGNEKRTPFFGLSNKEEEILSNEIDKFIKDL